MSIYSLILHKYSYIIRLIDGKLEDTLSNYFIIHFNGVLHFSLIMSASYAINCKKCIDCLLLNQHIDNCTKIIFNAYINPPSISISSY